MNREILFRGKRADGNGCDGQWIFGYGTTGDRIIHLDVYTGFVGVKIDPSTVGQYTGMTDKNGVKIFEGDICRVGNLTYQVVFQYSQWWFSIVDSSVYCCPYFYSHCEEHCEVIGTMFDGGEGN